MFNYFFNKYNKVILPYKLKLEEDSIIVEAYGEYLESFVVFHGVIKTKNINIRDFYIKLNELIEKNVVVEVNPNDFHIFKFNFNDLLDDSYINELDISDYKVLSEVSI